MSKTQTDTPLYATLLYGVRKQLGITVAEYYYIDMVYHLSRNDKGWCYKSLESIADDMGMSKNGVVKMRNRLIERGFIKKNIKGYTKTTEMYHSVVRGGNKPYHSVTNRTTKYTSAIPLSSTKNNIENNKEKGSEEKDNRGSIPPERFAELKAKLIQKIS